MARVPSTILIHGAESFGIEADLVTACCTGTGGHLAPVRFDIGGRWVTPYSLAPWQPAECAEGTPPILRLLRGDFFCLPFGENPGLDVHGEPANSDWECVAHEPARLVMRLAMRELPGTVTKTVSLKAGQRALYQEHLVEGLDGHFNYGHHAIIEFPAQGGPYFVNTGPFKYGSTFPKAFSDATSGEKQALAVGAEFTSLAKVPRLDGGTTSLNEYPARDGCEDLIMVSSSDPEFGWTAATLDGYVWVSLKDTRILPSTLFWISNGGRPNPPWNGVHRRRIGLEEVNSYFCEGLELSRQDLLADRGIATAGRFAADVPCAIRALHVAHPVPPEFGMVTSVERRDDDAITITGANGQTVVAPVNWQFIEGD